MARIEWVERTRSMVVGVRRPADTLPGRLAYSWAASGVATVTSQEYPQLVKHWAICLLSLVPPMSQIVTVGCPGCEMFEVQNVRSAKCSKCKMFEVKSVA